MSKPEIFRITRLIRNSISYKIDSYGGVLQTKKNSYNLPKIDEEKTKQKISVLIKSLCSEYAVLKISALLMDCLEEVKFQYLLSHNGFRLAKHIAKDQRVNVADIYAFSQAVTHCFQFLSPEIQTKPLAIVSGVMMPAGQDLGNTLLEQLWQTQGYKTYNLGAKIKPQTWIKAVDKHQPDFLSISCMLTACIDHLRELLALMRARKDNTWVCVGGMAINKTMVLQLSQEYQIPLFYGANFIKINVPQISKSRDVDQLQRENKILFLPEDIIKIPSGEIRCYQVPLAKVTIDDKIGRKKSDLHTYFNSAVIVTTSSRSDTVYDRKLLIRQLLEIETSIERSAHLAFSFHYPFTCPFCSITDCKEEDGKCMNPAYRRPFPIEFHIDISKTMENANILDLGLSSLVLVR